MSILTSRDRPLAYAALERTFFAEFLYKYAVDTPIAFGMDRGDNPRMIERDQLVRLMSLYADIVFVGQWDPDLGGRRLEGLSFIIIDPAGMVPLVALRRTKKPGSARAGTCRDHAINGPRSWTTQSRGTPAIDAQRTKLAQAASRHS